jgi:hypothetical protein
MSTQTTASNGSLVKYLLSAVLAITIPLGAYAFTSLDKRVEKAEVKTDKISALEVEVFYLRQAIERIEKLLIQELRNHGHHKEDGQ